MCEHLSRIENKLGVILIIKNIEEFPREERGHGHSHNLTCVILSEEKGNKKCAPIIE